MFPNKLCSIIQHLKIAKDPRLQRGFAQLIHHLIKTKSCLLSEWARSSLSFAAFIKKVSRLFQNKNVNWKINPLILGWFLPRFKNKKYIPILIDPSFIENKYLGAPTKTKSTQQKTKLGFFLLSAALPVKGRAISFFHHCYRYSQIKWRAHESINTLLQRQMIKIASLLKPVLAKAVFIMDRGFGYEFFLKTMHTLNLNYVIRARDLSTHIMMKHSKKEYKIAELAIKVKLHQPVIFQVFYKGLVPTSLVIIKTIIHGKLSTWVLMTNLDHENDAIQLYKTRMKIEETFKDWKSTGFNIEKLQIKLWDVLPRMIWCVVLAHMILYLMGESITHSKINKNAFKSFIQKRKNLSYVQLAWKVWLYDPSALNDFLHTLFLSLDAKRRAYL